MPVVALAPIIPVVTKYGPKAITMFGPVVGRKAAKAAQTVTSNKKYKKLAHDMAYERNGRYGQITFDDGVRRWVVAGGDGEVLKSFPALDNTSTNHLREQLVGVDLAKCLRGPEKQAKEAQRALREA
jgi:hypothetical protein